MSKTLAVNNEANSALPAPALTGTTMLDQIPQRPSSSECGSAATANSERIQVRIARSVQQVEGLREIWQRWQWNPNADIDFYLQVLRGSPEIVRPHVLVAYQDGAPAAMLIGRILQTQVRASLGYARLCKVRARTLIFIYGGQAGDFSPEISRRLVTEIVASLRSGEADAAEFRFLRTDSPLYAVAAHSTGLRSRDFFPAAQNHRSTKLENGVEGFYRGLSPKARKNIKWQAKKLLEEFANDVAIRCFQHSADLDRMMEDVESIAQKTYQRGLGVGFVNDAAMRERFEFEAEKGWLRAYVLYVSGNPCAFWIGSLCGETFHSSFMGYDPAYAKHSPGMYLVTKTLEELVKQTGDGTAALVDWGLGDAQYKQVLGDCEWKEASLYIFAPTFKGLRLNAIRTSAAIVDRSLRIGLGRLGLLQKIKKIWRDETRLSRSRPGEKSSC